MKQTTNPDLIEKYLADESNAFHASVEKVSGLFFPTTRAEVAQILTEANRKRLPVTVSGAGTGITGSRVPTYGGLVLTTESLLLSETPDQYEIVKRKTMVGEVSIAIDRQRSEVHVPAGIPLEIFAEILPPDLFYPPDPTEQSALIGATVATNASGARSFHYGATRDWVRGLKLVLPNGDHLTVRRGQIRASSQNTLEFGSDSGTQYRLHLPTYQMPPIKNAAGLYVDTNMDLVDLFIGSEGLLGVITEVIVAVIPKPQSIMGSICFLRSDEDALQFAAALRRMKEEGILSIEYFDQYSLEFLHTTHPEVQPEYKAAISIEFTIDEGQLLEKLAQLMEDHRIARDWSATDEKEIKRHKEFRHAVPEAVNTYLRRNNSYKMSTDFVVPEAHFPQMMRLYAETGNRFEEMCPRDALHYVVFGHIGDCHLHFNFITQSPQEMDITRELYTQLAQNTLRLGGTISGEHGVGKKTVQLGDEQVPYLELMYGKEGLREIARLKCALDTNCILNLGNMIPRTVLDEVRKNGEDVSNRLREPAS